MDFTDLYKSTVARKHVASWKPCGLVQHLWTHELNEQHLTSYVTHQEPYCGWWHRDDERDPRVTHEFLFLFHWVSPNPHPLNSNQNSQHHFKICKPTIFTWGTPVICRFSPTALAFFDSNRPWDRHSKAWNMAGRLEGGLGRELEQARKLKKNDG